MRLPLPEPALSDGVVALRAWAPGDAAALAAGWSDPDVQRWTGVPARRDEEAARGWIAGEATRRRIGRALDLVVVPVAHEPGVLAGEVSGEVGLADLDWPARRATIGWWMAPRGRGRGWAGRAVGLLASWALAELGLATLVAEIDPRNAASAAVARRAGFADDGSTRPNRARAGDPPFRVYRRTAEGTAGGDGAAGSVGA